MPWFLADEASDAIAQFRLAASMSPSRARDQPRDMLPRAKYVGSSCCSLKCVTLSDSPASFGVAAKCFEHCLEHVGGRQRRNVPQLGRARQRLPVDPESGQTRQVSSQSEQDKLRLKPVCRDQ